MSTLTPTPHNSAAPGDIAKTVLMPGDPLRAKYIAEHYLEDAVLVNNVRGVQGHTGTYKGVPLTVMASGMGMPSMAIYAYELYEFYGVENILRIGSAGAIDDTLELRDLVAAMSACTSSNFESQYDLPGRYAPTASFELLRTAVEVSETLGTSLKVGSFYTSDTFYDDTNGLEVWQKMHNVLAIEMETAALYMTAARAGKKALAICTISDCPLKGTGLSPEEREQSFTQMMELALETAAALSA